MELRTAHAGICFFGLIALSFVVRAVLAARPVERAFYGRIGACLIVYAVVVNGTLYYQASGNYKQGEWSDLPWTIAYCLLIVLAGTWSDREDAPATKQLSHSLELLAQFVPLLIPAIVFPLVLSIAHEQFVWSVVLTMVSFAAAAGRLFVVQSKLLSSSQEVKKNLALLRGIMESTPDAVFVKDLEGRYVVINPTAARFVEKNVDEVLGATDLGVFEGDTARMVMERDRQVIETGVTLSYEMERDLGGGRRIFLTTKGPYRDSE